MGNNDNNSKGMKFSKAVNRIMPAAIVIMLLISVCYLVAGQMLLMNDRGVSSGDSQCLDHYFEVKREDGGFESITIPGTYEQYGDGELVLTTELTPNVIDEWLMIWNMGHVLNVYIDDELRSAVNIDGRRLFKGHMVYQFDFVRLKESDTGKTLSIHFPEYANENHQLGSVYTGDKASLLLRAIRPYQFSLVLGLVMVAVGIITIVRVRVLPRKDERVYELFYMSAGVTFASAWFLFNSPAAQFLFPNIETAKDCAFFFASMIALPFLMYIGRLLKGRYAVILSVLKILAVISYLILMVGFFFTDFSINDLFIPTEITDVASLGVTLAILTGDIQSRRIREYYLAAVGLVGFVALALIYVILFILFPFRGDGGTVLMLGIVLLYFTSMGSYFKNKVRGRKPSA